MWQMINNGGAIALTNSKLIFKPNLNIFFISNYAKEEGGALHIRDYQCSSRSSVPLECFMTIDGPSTSTSNYNISLRFENNSAGITGSILYGGQLDQCRLFSSPLLLISLIYVGAKLMAIVTMCLKFS